MRSRKCGESSVYSVDASSTAACGRQSVRKKLASFSVRSLAPTAFLRGGTIEAIFRSLAKCVKRASSGKISGIRLLALVRNRPKQSQVAKILGLFSVPARTVEATFLVQDVPKKTQNFRLLNPQNGPVAGHLPRT
jgi:hypothetical protein